MFDVRTKVVWRQDIYEAEVSGPVRRDVERRCINIKRAAKDLAPRGRTGALKRSIKHLVQGERGDWWGYVYVDEDIAPHGLWVHQGTGRYGPNRRVIRPTSGQWLRYKPSEAGRFIRTRTVKGQKPNRFLKNALSAGLT